MYRNQFVLVLAVTALLTAASGEAATATAQTLSSNSRYTSPTDFVDAKTWETYAGPTTCEKAGGGAYWFGASIASRCVYKTCQAMQHLFDCWNASIEAFVCSEDEMEQIEDEFAEARLACSLGTFYSDDDGSGSTCVDSTCLSDATLASTTVDASTSR